jgi:hypothetical protein
VSFQSRSASAAARTAAISIKRKKVSSRAKHPRPLRALRATQIPEASRRFSVEGQEQEQKLS